VIFGRALGPRSDEVMGRKSNLLAFGEEHLGFGVGSGELSVCGRAMILSNGGVGRMIWSMFDRG
jgi:hypothetical protein